MAVCSKTATKRTAADSQAKPSAPKRAKVSKTPVEKKIARVMEALMNEETVVPGPESCRSMLVAAATAALKIPKDIRHADQDAVLGMLTQVFGAEKGRWEARVADASATLERATVERTEKMGAKDAADTELKAQKDVVSEKMQAQSDATGVEEDCKHVLAAALTQREDAEVEQEKLVKTLEHDLAVQETIKGLKEGIYENPKELKKHIAAVSALFEMLGAEDALVTTLPQILRCTPSERGSFDEVALQQLDVYLNNHFSSLKGKIEVAEVIVAEHAVAATAWDAAVEVAEQKKRESEDALQAAEAQQEVLQEALNCSRKVLKECTAVVKNRSSDVATEQCGEQAVDDVLEALQFLQLYVVPVPEETKEPKEPEELEVVDESADTPAEMPVEKVDVQIFASACLGA